MLFFGMSASVAMELAIAVAVGAYSVFSRRSGAFGRFKEVREERGDIPGLTVTRWSDFSSLWTSESPLVRATQIVFIVAVWYFLHRVE